MSFQRKWREYVKGFGDLHTEFWYGLEEIYYLTKNGQWEMRVDYQESNKLRYYIQYNQFGLGSANQQYSLAVGEFFNGEGSDYWFNQQGDRAYVLNGMRFSTEDNDNDRSSGNCAVNQRSGWWYNECALLNINRQPPHISTGSSSNRAVLFTEMKIRPKDCIKQ